MPGMDQIRQDLEPASTCGKTKPLEVHRTTLSPLNRIGGRNPESHGSPRLKHTARKEPTPREALPAQGHRHP